MLLFASIIEDLANVCLLLYSRLAVEWAPAKAVWVVAKVAWAEEA